MSQRKTFALLRRRPGGVMPQNRLSYPAQRIEIPTSHSVNAGQTYVVKPLSLDTKERQLEVRTCYFVHVSIGENGLGDHPRIVLDLQAANYNGTQISQTRTNRLQVCVAEDGQHLFFRHADALIDRLVLPKKSIHKAYFSEDFGACMLVFLKSNFGFVTMSFSLQGILLYDMLVENRDFWGVALLWVVPSEKLRDLHEGELRKRENAHRDPLTVIHTLSTPASEGEREDEDNDQGKVQETNDGIAPNDKPGALISDDVLSNGLPSIPALSKQRPPSRQTRSASRRIVESTHPHILGDSHVSNLLSEIDEAASGDDDLYAYEQVEDVARETPASFEPPLHYTVNTEKKFIISYNDFKTLYNNDWINDTLIDFFIAYEIEKAVTLRRLVLPSEVFAFNSFFFTKLFTKTEAQKVAPYYKNIERWLAKVDLMSYSSIVIPINEHLHWYCVIIKNLPKLLEHYKRPAVETITQDQPKKPIVDIFVIDSLKQTHSNLDTPLKEVIATYCREKHGIDISTSLIRLRAARVSRQRDFNDCGIHVIYNISKWLESPAVCELIWKSNAKPKHFKGSERNGMRRACIDLLLDLHSKQPVDSVLAEDKRADESQSEDEIELISYLTSCNNDADQEKKVPDNEGLALKKNTSTSEASDDDLKKDETHSQQLHTKTPGQDKNTPEKVDGANERTAATARRLPIQAPSTSNTEMKSKISVEDIKHKSLDSEELKHRSIAQVVLEQQRAEQEQKRRKFMKELEEKREKKRKQLHDSSRQPSPHQRRDSSASHKTLDPRALERPTLAAPKAMKNTEEREMAIQHPQIRRLVMHNRVKKHTIDFLNTVFKDYARRFSDCKLSELHKLIQDYDGLEALIYTERFRQTQRKIIEVAREETTPMDEPFVIKDAEESDTLLDDPDDSNGELNKSVGDLSISKSTLAGTHKKQGTPEATRQFLRQAETESYSPVARKTRSRVQQVAEDLDSDLEIVDDLGVSEVSLVFSSPRENKHRFSGSDRSLKYRKTSPSREVAEGTRVTKKTGTRDSKITDVPRALRDRRRVKQLKEKSLDSNIAEVVDISEEEEQKTNSSPNAQKRRRLKETSEKASGFQGARHAHAPREK